MSRAIQVGNRWIGREHPCCIVFEIGPTHNGVDSAVELIKQAHAAGADAVKFQVIDPDRLVADRSITIEYECLTDRETGATEKVTENLYEILQRRTLSRAEWRTVRKTAADLGILFFATVAFEDELEFLVEIGCDSVKIASSDVNHLPLIRQAACTGMCIQMDTGSATIGEIETAVDAIVSEGNDRIIIHQVPSGYPARLDSIHLNMIPTLARMFEHPIAFSDHTPGAEMDIAALALGADLVEKTITLDRTTRSIEHIFSLEKEELPAFVQTIREVEKGLGSNRRTMGAEQKNHRRKFRRSAFAANDIRKGDQISDENIMFQRPGTGIAPSEYEHLFSSIATEDIPAGSMISWKQIDPKS